MHRLNLKPAQVRDAIDCFDAGLGLLHGLTTGESTETVHITFFGATVYQIPEFFRTKACQGVLRLKRTSQSHHVIG